MLDKKSKFYLTLPSSSNATPRGLAMTISACSSSYIKQSFPSLILIPSMKLSSRELSPSGLKSSLNFFFFETPFQVPF